MKKLWEIIQGLNFEMNYKKTIFVIYAISMAFLVYIFSIENKVLKQNLEARPLPEDFTAAQNEVVSLKRKNKELEDAIAYFESRGETVKTITKIKTVLKGGETVYKVLPGQHTFKLGNGMPVAEFEAGEEYKFTTYDLTFKTTVLIGEEQTIVKLTGQSSGTKEEFVLPVESIVTQENKHGQEEEKERILDPRIAIGAGISYPYTKPEVILTVPVLETRNDRWSFIAPTFSVSEKVKIGIIPALYNVGKPLPLMDNVWLGIGYETDIINHYGTVSLTAKL